jgi:hypothetical protein
MPALAQHCVFVQSSLSPEHGSDKFKWQLSLTGESWQSVLVPAQSTAGNDDTEGDIFTVSFGVSADLAFSLRTGLGAGFSANMGFGAGFSATLAAAGFGQGFRLS